MIVVARNAATGTTTYVETASGQRRYRLEVPAGAYTVFAIPVVTASRGQILRGAHTQYTLCNRDRAKSLAGQCRTGALVEVRLEAQETREDVDVDDWYMPEALAATLNLSIADAPRLTGSAFDAYPANTGVLPKTRPPDLATVPAAAISFRSRIERMGTRGPNYAGRVAVGRWACGNTCENWALADLVSGRVVWIEDKALQPVRRNFPCEAEPLEYREDSRLLRVHRADGERVLTQDFLWSDAPPRLEKIAESAQSAAQFCRR